MWNELCDLISKNPEKIHSLNVDAIIRGGLRRYTDQLGHLWNSLANYYVRSGLFDRARDIYEEAIQTITTVRDFTQVFDAYAQFEELSLSKRMEEVANLQSPTEDDDIDLELRLARFEHLMERRLLLLNSVLLRQNPHNVQEWHKRVQLYEGKNNVSILLTIIGNIFNKLKELVGLKNIDVASPKGNKIYYLSRKRKFKLQKRRLD